MEAKERIFVEYVLHDCQSDLGPFTHEGSSALYMRKVSMSINTLNVLDDTDCGETSSFAFDHLRNVLHRESLDLESECGSSQPWAVISHKKQEMWIVRVIQMPSAMQ